VKNVTAIERRWRSKAIDDNVFQRKSSTKVSTAGQASNNEDLPKNCQRMKQCAVDWRHFRHVLYSFSKTKKDYLYSSEWRCMLFFLLESSLLFTRTSSRLDRGNFKSQQGDVRCRWRSNRHESSLRERMSNGLCPLLDGLSHSMNSSKG
jgi:hypothetical protein